MKMYIPSSRNIWVATLGWAVALSAVLATPILAQQAKTKTLNIPEGTVVRIVFTEELSSETNHPNDAVHCEVAEDVRVDNKVVIAKGAPTVGQVSQAEKRGGWGKSGTLSFSIDYAKAVDGSNVRLRGSSAQGGKQFSPGAAMLGLSGGLKKGKPVTVAKGTNMDIYVDKQAEVSVVIPGNS